MRTKIYNLKYRAERLYPYFFALVVTLLCMFIKVDVTGDSGYGELLNGLITLDSIIIGFLGAVMPVILSMKNESKFVKYVFEKDKKNLFCKYLKVTLFLGICNVVISLIEYVRLSIPIKIQPFVYYVWIFLSVAFLVSTYRSMSYMITLIFRKDVEDEDGENENNIPESRRDELKQKYKNNS